MHFNTCGSLLHAHFRTLNAQKALHIECHNPIVDKSIDPDSMEMKKKLVERK